MTVALVSKSEQTVDCMAMEAVLHSLPHYAFADKTVVRTVMAYCASDPYLDWTLRPLLMQQAIGHAFDNLRRDWQYNGSLFYEFCSVQEHALIKTIIREAPSQRVFNFVDIGAGMFQWGQNLALCIRSDPKIPPHIQINIFSLNGEPYGDKVRAEGQCMLYEWGSFKIEELQSGFEKRGFFLDGSVDFAVSRWCLRHLVDPVGAFVQTYQLLRKDGFFCFDGFIFLFEGERIREVDAIKVRNASLVALVQASGASFLFEQLEEDHRLHRFILRKPASGSCNLPLSYMDVLRIGGRGIASNSVTRFKRTSLHALPLTPVPKAPATALTGSQELFAWLQKHDLFQDPSPSWAALT